MRASTSPSGSRTRNPGATFLARSLILAVTLAPIGCHRRNVRATAADATTTPTTTRSCASNQDCDDGWACLAGRCADARKIGAFTHSDQTVTPDKVRQEVERQQERHMRGIDKALEGSDTPAGR